jgi:hypothetical protein
MSKRLGVLLVIGMLASCYSVFAQAAQERIVQPIVVNGQQAQGVIVVQNGTIQSQTCSMPQQYVTADQSSSGWACFEASTGTWLLDAQPPAQASVPQQQAPAVVYTTPAPVYVPGPYPYAYGYYAGYPYYPYPYFWGPSFAFGFGFGYRAPVFAGRPFFGRPFVGAVGFRSGGFAVGRGGRR